MTPERWREVEAILQAALECEPGEREAFLDEACGRDAALRQEVESRLTAALPRGDAGAAARPLAGGRDLTERLRAALGAAYSLERELGAGGMSHVFVAEETALGRRVVVKVLLPQFAAGLDAERFHREIRLAASLQHPHVVPVHSAGEADGLLYYTMPFVEGESLRHRLEREGALPLADIVRLLREITDALAYAHRRGVIHRDLKPANILLEDGHALVTDFGIAKALTAAAGSAARAATLTATGLVLGTPAYMAPEQAAADPAVDHRADLYALGCLAYELLTGQPPFAGSSVQALIAAHVIEAPEPVANRRTGLPRELAALVMRLLEKRPAARPQSAEEVLRELEAVGAAGRAAPLLGILGLYGACSLVAVGVARLAMVQLGLPDWVVPAAVVLLLIGLPVVSATALVQRGRVPPARGVARVSSATLRHWLTWRRAIAGGVSAFAALGLAAAGYMAMRALGIGPAGTLLAAGVLRERERLLVADFENRTRDSLLGPVVTEAFRIDLAQSPVVTLVPPEQVAEVLTRMKRPAAMPLQPAVAREVALREGIRVVVTGEIVPVGARYLLSARLLSATSGAILAARRETAGDSSELLDAVDRLSRKLRERVGESLKTLRREQPLERVTTGSLEALRKYTQGMRAISVEGDYESAVPLFEEAIALDSGFAMAYADLGGALMYYIGEPERGVRALTRAFERRDRLPERERLHAMAMYYDMTGELERAVAAWRRLLETYPDDARALHRLGLAYLVLRQDARAEVVLRRAITLDVRWQPYALLMEAQVNLGKRRAAELTRERAIKQFSDNPWVEYFASLLASSGGDYRAAEARGRALQERHSDNRTARALASEALAPLAASQGRLAETEQHLRDVMQVAVERGDTTGYLAWAITLGKLDVWFRNHPARGLKEVEAALARYWPNSLKLDRPYLELTRFYALAGKPTRARALLTEYEGVVEPMLRYGDESEPLRHGVLGEVALAEGRLADAVAEFRAEASRGRCRICGLAGLGRAYDRMDEPDSAIAIYERYVTTPDLHRISPQGLSLSEDAMELAGIYKRLGELYEQRGDGATARDYYTRFVELWKDCDPELKPQVAEAWRRLTNLSGEPGA